ncbi:hypothetical protein OEZ85_014159 [Tetradesmus obliquus]|uniref:BZIP domain-containing protein n=1 Tax=Tetradesmus obliquus TaxID=3088 RepID=A0ABY8U758_TETOB|nr:hypothetical protein OEZ85_014159 [Tetradesmus obliquus]
MSDIPDPIQSESSSDSFQSFLARALGAGAPTDLPDVAAPEGPAAKASPRKVEERPRSATQSQSDTGAGRDGGPGQQQVNMVAHSSHHSSAGGTCSDTPPPEMELEGRGRGRGRGRRSKRSSGQETAQQRAHRRFYERKKLKMSALEQEAAEKLALYQRLQRENAELKRNIPSAGADLAGSEPVAIPQQQQQQQQQHPAGSPPETLLMASRLLQARHEAAGYFPAAAAAASGDADFVYVHQVVEWYRSKLQELSQLLPRVDRHVPDVAAGLALVQVVEELLMGVRKFSTRNRVGLWELKLINLESGDFEEAPPNHWRSLLHSMAFSREARGKLDACFSLYKDHMGKARAERQEVLQEMAELCAELHGSDDDVTNVTSDQAGPFAAAVAGMGGSSSYPQQQQQQQQQQCEAPRSLQFREDGLDRI